AFDVFHHVIPGQRLWRTSPFKSHFRVATRPVQRTDSRVTRAEARVRTHQSALWNRSAPTVSVGYAANSNLVRPAHSCRVPAFVGQVARQSSSPRRLA